VAEGPTGVVGEEVGPLGAGVTVKVSVTVTAGNGAAVLRQPDNVMATATKASISNESCRAIVEVIAPSCPIVSVLAGVRC